MQAGGLAAWEILRTLVAFDTTSRESNLALIDWVRGWLADHGVEATLTYDDDRRKANLFATLPARDGNAVTGGIVLSGHTDVVPVDGQPWTRPPFTATPEGDPRWRWCPSSRAAALRARCTSRCRTTRKWAASACDA